MSNFDPCEVCVQKVLRGQSHMPERGVRVVFAITPEGQRFTIRCCKPHAAHAVRIYRRPQAYMTNPEVPGTMVEGRFQ